MMSSVISPKIIYFIVLLTVLLALKQSFICCGSFNNLIVAAVFTIVTARDNIVTVAIHAIIW